jgi:hypothetical protein
MPPGGRRHGKRQMGANGPSVTGLGGPSIRQPTLAMASATAVGVHSQSSGGSTPRSQPASRNACSKPPGVATTTILARSELTL